MALEQNRASGSSKTNVQQSKYIWPRDHATEELPRYFRWKQACHLFFKQHLLKMERCRGGGGWVGGVGCLQAGSQKLN